MLHFTNVVFLKERRDYQKCVFMLELIPDRFKIRTYVKAVSEYYI